MDLLAGYRKWVRCESKTFASLLPSSLQCSPRGLPCYRCKQQGISFLRSHTRRREHLHALTYDPCPTWSSSCQSRYSSNPKVEAWWSFGCAPDFLGWIFSRCRPRRHRTWSFAAGQSWLRRLASPKYPSTAWVSFRSARTDKGDRPKSNSKPSCCAQRHRQISFACTCLDRLISPATSYYLFLWLSARISNASSLP